MRPSLAYDPVKPDYIKSHTRRIEGPAGAIKVAAGLIFLVQHFDKPLSWRCRATHS
jgi:hypothetical protein